MILFVFAAVAAILAVAAIFKGEGPLTATAILVLALAFVVQHGGWVK